MKLCLLLLASCVLSVVPPLYGYTRNVLGEFVWPISLKQHEGQCGGVTDGGWFSSASACVFPFKYHGEWRYGCIPNTGSKSRKQCWCSQDRIYTDDSYRAERYEWCDNSNWDAFSACPRWIRYASSVPLSKKCVFPFKFDGETYNSCTRASWRNKPAEGGFPYCWCSTTAKFSGHWVVCNEYNNNII